jgi:hypothetical protein
LNDLTTAATVAFTASEKADGRLRWEQVALGFLGGKQQEKGPKTLKRTKVYEWLVATNHMLHVATGAAWLRRKRPAAVSPEEERCLPSVTLSIDQGSDGWSAAHYLRSEGVTLLVLPDQSHRVWNDVKNALQESGVFPQILITIVLLNADHGPWQEARWFETLKEGVAEYLKVASPACPVFTSWYPCICEEMGEQAPAPGHEREVFDSLAEVFRKKTPKVGLARWFGYVDALEAFLPSWSRRLVVTLYVALQLGLFEDKKATDVLKVSLAEHKGVDEKTSLAADKERMRKLRGACSNTLSFCAMHLSDRSLYRTNLMVAALTAPLRRWHGLQNQKKTGRRTCPRPSGSSKQ